MADSFPVFLPQEAGSVMCIGLLLLESLILIPANNTKVARLFLLSDDWFSAKHCFQQPLH
jgi:hypothetical protein